MGHGGARKGAGRKPGAATKRTREAADRLMAEGTTPLDVLLGMMRGAISFDEDRFEAAKAAAPYVHARLMANKIEAKAELTLGELIDQAMSRRRPSDEEPDPH